MSKTVFFNPIILTAILWFAFIENKSNLKLITIYIKEWSAVEEMGNKFNISILTTDPLITALIDGKKDEPFIKALNERNIKYTSIDSSVVLQDLIKWNRNTSSRVTGFDYENRYHNLEEIYAELDRIKSVRKDGSIDVFTIGTSHQKRNIKAIKISNRKQNDGFKELIAVIECGVHSNEWLPIAFCMYAINKLLNARNEEPFIHFNFIIIPVLNPDGYKNTWKLWHYIEKDSLASLSSLPPDEEWHFWHSRLHRKNMQIVWPQNTKNITRYCNIGTDLNRNFNTPEWCGVGASNKACDRTFCGRFPYSAPETETYRRYMVPLRRKIVLYFSFHAYQGMWLYPWGYTKDPPHDSELLSEWSRKAVNAMNKVYGVNYTCGQLSNKLYPAAGGSVDWAYRTLNAYSFVFEMWPIFDNQKYDGRGPPTFLNFLVPEFAIKSACVETFVGLNVTLGLYWSHNMGQKPEASMDGQNSGLSYQYMSSIITIIIIFVFAFIIRNF